MLVYLIRNKINGKGYVGQTIRSLEIRWKNHCQKNRVRTRMPISLAIQKYGPENFEVEVLEECASVKELNLAEVLWTLKLQTFWPKGYNLRAGGSKGHLSDELKRRIGQGNQGKKASTETRRKLSDSHKGIRQTAEARRKLSEYWKGRPRLNRRGVSTKGKSYELVSPEGEILRVESMRQFCRENGHSTSKMSELVNGKRAYYKGWKGRILAE